MCVIKTKPWLFESLNKCLKLSHKSNEQHLDWPTHIYIDYWNRKVSHHPSSKTSLCDIHNILRSHFKYYWQGTMKLIQTYKQTVLQSLCASFIFELCPRNSLFSIIYAHRCRHICRLITPLPQHVRPPVQAGSGGGQTWIILSTPGQPTFSSTPHSPDSSNHVPAIERIFALRCVCFCANS